MKRRRRKAAAATAALKKRRSVRLKRSSHRTELRWSCGGLKRDFPKSSLGHAVNDQNSGSILVESVRLPGISG